MNYFLSLFVFFLTCNFSYAQLVAPAVKITPSVRSSYDIYGHNVSIGDNVAVVGASLNDQLGYDAGMAFVYTQNSNGIWEETQILTASDGAAMAHFGNPAVSGNYLLIGASGTNLIDSSNATISNAGAAYVFERNSSGIWEEVAKLTAEDANAGDGFGGSVAIYGRYAIVCAEGQDYDADGNNYLDNAGAVYFFQRTDGGDWLQVQKLTVSNRAAGDGLSGVAIHGTTAVVGVSGANTDVNGQQPVSAAGAAYVFERNSNGTWVETQKITANQRSANDAFGYSIAIFGNYLLVSALFEDEDASGNNTVSNAGAAYLFGRPNNGLFTQLQKITSPIRNSEDQFGSSVALYGNYALVGAHFANLNNNGTGFMNDAGAAYLYQWNATGTWQLIQSFVAPDRAIDDEFGRAVAIHGGHILLGAPYENEDANGGDTRENAGSVYQFEIMNPVGLSEETPDFPLTIWPNPAENQIHIAIGTTADEWTVSLRDVTGKLLNQTVHPNTVEIEYDLTQPSGIYFLEVKSENATAVRKIIIR